MEKDEISLNSNDINQIGYTFHKLWLRQCRISPQDFILHLWIYIFSKSVLIFLKNEWPLDMAHKFCWFNILDQLKWKIDNAQIKESNFLKSQDHWLFKSKVKISQQELLYRNAGLTVFRFLIIYLPTKFA